MVLIETRVNRNKAQGVRDKLRLSGRYLDDYDTHENSRILLEWDDNRFNIRLVESTI